MNLVMTALVAHKHRWVVLEEPASVVVAVHVDRQNTLVPADRTIEVVQSHILLILFSAGRP